MIYLSRMNTDESEFFLQLGSEFILEIKDSPLQKDKQASMHF